MAEYAIAFDMNTTAMNSDGLTESDRTRIYQTEIPQALAAAGFTHHAQGSVYVTEGETDPLAALVQLQHVMDTQAPNFRVYCNRVHLFRVEDWSDVTSVLTDQSAAAPMGMSTN